MKSISKIAMLSCLALSSVVAQEVSLDFFNKLEVVKDGGIQVVKYQELDNIYYLKGKPINTGQGNGAFEFFLTKNFKQIIVGGKAIDATTKNEIKFMPSNDRLEALKGAEVITYGTGKEVLYLFTDPECPYCKDFEKRLPSLKEKYTFKIFMFPLSFHKNAKKMSRYVMAGQSEDIKFDRLLEVANGLTTYQDYQGSVEETERLNLEIEKQIQLGLGVEINGTPILMKPDGTRVNLGNI